jgi:HSP20 family protein
MRDLIPWKRKNAAPAVREGEDLFSAFQREMNDLFDGFFGSRGEGFAPTLLSRGLRTPEVLTPRIDVEETDKQLEVTAELPGMEEKDIEVTLDEDRLTIKGEKKTEREEKNKTALISECSYGSFQRVIPVPAGVERDKAKAKFKNGVLKLTLPKAERAGAERRKIEIASG